MTDSPEAIKKTVRLYLIVGITLFVMTTLTWAVADVSWLDFGKHGFDRVDCIIGLCIAAFKASLVAAIFMHLNHEKKTVYWLIAAGVCAVFSLAGFTALALNDPIVDKFFYSGH